MSSPSFIKIMDDAAKAMVFAKFKSFLSITDSVNDIVFAPKEIAQRKIAEKRGNNTVEFISLWRDGIELDWARQNTPIARRGIMMNYGDSSAGGTGTDRIITVKAVPASINYDMWVWSRDLDKIAQVTEEYIKWLHSTPQLILYYNGIYEMNMYLKFGGVKDETNYDIYNKGLYFVSRFPINLDGWVLTSIDTKTVLQIILDVYLREGTSPDYVDTLLSEYIIDATP